MNGVLTQKAEETVKILKEKGITLATAESYTGGLLSAVLTTVSGVSQVFELGVTSYSCRIKNEVLGVEAQTLTDFGAISEQTARQMAENVRRIAGSNIGTSVTGVAGPQSSEGHPVGYIFIAVAGSNGTKVQLLNIEDRGRNAVRESAVCAVLDLIEYYIKDI